MRVVTEDRGAFVPIALPPGAFLLDTALDDRLRETTGAPPRRGDIAHPAAGFVASLGGAGLEVAAMLGLCGLSLESGPLLAACEMTFARPLRVDRRYEVRGEIADVRHKPSRRFGAADHVTLRFALAAEAQPYGTLELRMIVPAGRDRASLPRPGEVAAKLTEGEVGDHPSTAPPSSPSVMLRMPPPPAGGGYSRHDTPLREVSVDAPWRLDVAAAAMIPWVEALRDANPIHRDPAASAALGFGHRTVNPGPTNLAYVLNMVEAAAPDTYPTRIEARFLGNVFSGDAVEVTGGRDGDGAYTASLAVPARGDVVLDVRIELGPRA